MVKILIAPDSFKGTLTAPEVACVMGRRLRRDVPDVELRLLPLGDGGDGTLQAMQASLGGELQVVTVSDPLGRPIPAEYLILPDATVMVEMARASGLTLLAANELNPMNTHTYGTGELLNQLPTDCRSLIIGLGGTATVDGGMGLARALGGRFFDARHRELEGRGADLSRVTSMDITDLSPRWQAINVRLMVDVENPLLGPHGAAMVFGPQKGATPDQVDVLEQGMVRLSVLFQRVSGCKVADLPGTGAAGGAAAMLHVLLGGSLQSGASLMLDAVGFDEHLRWADWVITGEGFLDAQSLGGKLPVVVARRCRAAGVPVWALPGRVAMESGELLSRDFEGIIACGESTPTGAVEAAARLDRATECWIGRTLR